MSERIEEITFKGRIYNVKWTGEPEQVNNVWFQASGHKPGEWTNIGQVKSAKSWENALEIAKLMIKARGH